MQAPRFNDVKVGDQLPPLALPAINRTTLALYCGTQPTCTGVVTEKFEADGEQRVKVALRCANQYGEDKLLGEAIVALK